MQRAVMLFAAGFAAALLPAGEPFDTLHAACAGGSPASCARLGDLLERGAIAPIVPEEPGLYFELACEGGVACDRAAPWARRYGDYEIYEVDAGCMVRANPYACEEVATTLRDGDEASPAALPIARDRMVRAQQLYLAACARRDAAACFGASRVYAAGFGVAWDLVAAQQFAVAACSLGAGDACEDAAARSGEPALYRRACALGWPHACQKLAVTP